jgi:hypothetical protein
VHKASSSPDVLTEVRELSQRETGAILVVYESVFYGHVQGLQA